MGRPRPRARPARLISIVDPGNTASLGVTRKLGMVEGWSGEREGRPHVVMVLDL